MVPEKPPSSDFVGFLRIPWAGAWLLKNGLRTEDRAGQVSAEDQDLGAWPFKGLVLFLSFYKVLPRSHDPPRAFAYAVGSI